MKRYVLIVAGGKGLRMGGDIPKQFLPLNGRPVLMHTIEAFHRFDETMGIIVVLPADQREYWEALCKTHGFEISHRIIEGGQTRFYSVKNGLNAIEGNEGVVGVHDGVRPFVSQEVIRMCYQEAERLKAVIPVIDTIETIRHVISGKDGEKSVTVPRDEYKLVQTPQVFSLSLLKKAYEQPYDPCFTDDASVIEAFGQYVTLVKGNRENIKLTTPFDLKIAKALL